MTCVSEKLLTPHGAEAYYSMLHCVLRDPYSRVVIISRVDIQSVRMGLPASSYRYFRHYYMDRSTLCDECATNIVHILYRLTGMCAYLNPFSWKRGKVTFWHYLSQKATYDNRWLLVTYNENISNMTTWKYRLILPMKSVDGMWTLQGLRPSSVCM